MTEYSPLPTSEEELHEQVDAAFKPEPSPEAAPDSSQQYQQGLDEEPDIVEPFEPSDEMLDGVQKFLVGRVNPKFISKGIAPLNPSELSIMTDGICGLGVAAQKPMELVIEKTANMSPLGQALFGLGFASATIALPRLVDRIFNRKMRDVTPKSAPANEGEAPGQSFTFEGSS